MTFRSSGAGVEWNVVVPRVLLLFVHQTWRTCCGVTALLLLFLIFLLCASLQRVLLSENLLCAEPLELVLSFRNVPSLNLLLLPVNLGINEAGSEIPTCTLQIASTQLRPWVALLAWKV